MAGKTNANASQIDKTSFWWTGLCGICHPGGGPTEFDRDGEQYYDAKTGQFGYEKLGKTAGQVTLDGDYMPGNAFSLNYFKVQTGGAGIPYCVIFRPDEFEVKAGARYWLEIGGLTSRSGDPRPVKFLVEFFEL